MMTSAAETPSSPWMPRGDAAAVVGHRDRAVGVQRHRHARGVARQRLVDGVVDDLVDHVVQTRAVVGVADVHARSLAHRIETPQDLDGIGAVRLGIGVGVVWRGTLAGRLFHISGMLSIGGRAADGGAKNHLRL